MESLTETALLQERMDPEGAAEPHLTPRALHGLHGRPEPINLQERRPERKSGRSLREGVEVQGARAGRVLPAELLHHRAAQAVMPRVLVIDDDDDLLQMARAILSTDGYLVDTAYAGIDGVHKALRFPPDVILLDVLMSDCDALEIFDTLRSHERTREVPVLALSSLAGRDAARLLLDVGFAALIEKPVDWPVLRRELRRRVSSRAI